MEVIGDKINNNNNSSTNNNFNFSHWNQLKITEIIEIKMFYVFSE